MSEGIFDQLTVTGSAEVDSLRAKEALCVGDIYHGLLALTHKEGVSSLQSTLTLVSPLPKIKVRTISVPFVLQPDGGGVGIGMTQPESALHLRVPESEDFISAMTIDVQSFNTFHNAQASHFLRVRDIGANPPDGKTYFLIRGDGNVGIGTTTPSAKLEINLVNPNGWSENKTGIRLTSPDDKYCLDVKPYIINSKNVGYQLSPIGPDSAQTGLVIDTLGNVGIGTTTPNNKLEVKGVIEIETEEDCQLRFNRTGVKWLSMGLDEDDDRKFKINYGGKIGETNHFTMDSSGNVGIGTSSPNAKLNVKGDIRINDNTLWLRGADNNHGIGWFGVTKRDEPRIFAERSIDGPVVFGYGGGALGTTAGGQKIALSWDKDGNVKVRGDIFLENADVAEDFDIMEPATIELGTVMVIDRNGRLCQSEHAYDHRVAGVISGAGNLRPGITLDKQEKDTNRLPLALTGKVYCKVDAQYGPIEVGALLTTSPTLGHAMKASDSSKALGAVIGKALRELTNGQGLIPILVALQ